jgi:hypothetical protein
LLLVFASTVIIAFGPCWDPWPYFCSFQVHLHVLKWSFLFNKRRGWTFCVYSEQSSNLLLAFTSLTPDGPGLF